MLLEEHVIAVADWMSGRDLQINLSTMEISHDEISHLSYSLNNLQPMLANRDRATNTKRKRTIFSNQILDALINDLNSSNFSFLSILVCV